LERAKKGLANGGLTPFGYNRQDKKLIPHPKETEEIKSIFETYIESGSTVTLCYSGILLTNDNDEVRLYISGGNLAVKFCSIYVRTM
jgi:hypothetical protein